MDALVTQNEWKEIMDYNLSEFKNHPNNPVENVSYYDIQKFLKKLNEDNKDYFYNLPTEEEWEYCSKSCDEQDINEISWNLENSNKISHPVKLKKPNKFGLYDMLGNVWEWTDSLQGSDRVIRGGGWGSNARFLRSGYRNYYSPGFRYYDVGFRLVRTKFHPKVFNQKLDELLK